MKKFAIVLSVMMAVIFTAVTVSAQSVTTTHKAKTEKTTGVKTDMKCTKTCDKATAGCAKACAGEKEGTMMKSCCAKGQVKADATPVPKDK
jgi:hypothetical protein